MEKAILNSQITFLVTNKTKKGFTIKLNKTASEDIEFSWTALAVKDVKKTVGKKADAVNQATQNETQPSNLPVQTPIPTITPSPSASPAASPSATPPPSSVVSTAEVIKVLDNDLGFLRVRSEPNSDSQEIAQAKPGQNFEVLDSQYGFYKIEYESNKTGWVSSTYVTVE